MGPKDPGETAPERFAVGESVLWRSRPGRGPVGYVVGSTVVMDGPKGVALFHPGGSPIQRRDGARGGPQGRSLLPGGWNGKHVAGVYRGNGSVRANDGSSPYSVVRQWDGSGFVGWYVNLEDPWERVPVGFDSQDLTLDLVFADDRSSWTRKDEDELAWQVEVGIRSVDEAAWIHETGDLAVEHERQGSGVFGLDWDQLHPDPSWPMPSLPAGWAR